MQNDETTFAALGMAALLPGMQHMLTLMQESLDQMRAALNVTQNGAASNPAPERGRPAGSKNRRYGWSDDPEERKAEMARRMAGTPKKPAVKLHPRDAAHPEHAAWVRKMRKANKKMWAALTPKQRTERAAKAAAGRAAKKKQTARQAIRELKAVA